MLQEPGKCNYELRIKSKLNFIKFPLLTYVGKNYDIDSQPSNFRIAGKTCLLKHVSLK